MIWVVTDLRNIGTTVLLLTSVMLGQRLNTSQALPNTVSASALNTQDMDSISNSKSNSNSNKNRYRCNELIVELCDGSLKK